MKTLLGANGCRFVRPGKSAPQFPEFDGGDGETGGDPLPGDDQAAGKPATIRPSKHRRPQNLVDVSALPGQNGQRLLAPTGPARCSKASWGSSYKRKNRQGMETSARNNRRTWKPTQLNVTF